MSLKTFHVYTCDGCEFVIQLPQQTDNTLPVPLGWEFVSFLSNHRRLHYCPQCVRQFFKGFNTSERREA